MAFSHYGDVSPHTMILIYITYLVSSVSCLKLIQKENNTSNHNVTTLYPVDNITYHITEANNVFKDNLIRNNEKEMIKPQATDKTSDTKLKGYESYVLSKLKETEIEQMQNHNVIDMTLRKKQDKKSEINPLTDTTSWKVNATYSKSKLNLNDNKNNITDDSYNNENESFKQKEFKPSPQLGNFYDEDKFVVPTQATIGSFTPHVSKPSMEFVSSPRDLFPLNYKRPVNAYYDAIGSPYKFEHILPRTKDWKFETGLETKPTMEAPLMIPAGGLYKLPDAFKDKPSSDGDDDDFGLDFKDSKDTSLKKRFNPWKKILNFVTALVPVGIIISALTPSIITLESADNNPRFPSRISRRSGESVAELPSISERCKRRLLCELHSNTNYIRDTSAPNRQNLCYKIPCNDPQALSKVLRWLLQHHDSRGHRHTLHDRRGFIT
ncbi:uncharacterized protein LOC126769721 [Nymphalis io]|uniref:uncharacterized protein LOC126769721 n=1 Tax=Inachis io TaxID=171585 RepID=UPI0021671F62|nr:uncharacterized protein LOC126769721 [Nymphalis io]